MKEKFKKIINHPATFIFGGWLVLSLIIGGVFWLVNHL